MKCLVTGATGFVGQELCRQLSRCGHEVVAFSGSGRTLDDGTTTSPVDFRSTNLDGAQLAGVEVVFHLAGIAHQQASAQDYERVNQQATLTLARLAEAAGVRCFLFLSSVKAMGPASVDQGARAEGDCALPRDDYGLSKWMAESALNREFGDSQMSVSVIRPALVYAAHAKGNLHLLSRAVASGLPRPPLAGARSMIALQDLCSLLLYLAQEGGTGVCTYIATDGERYTLRRVYDALREFHAMPPGRAWWPRWVWRAACALLDWRRPGGEPSWDKLFGDELYSNELVVRATSWRPGRCLEDALPAGAGQC